MEYGGHAVSDVHDAGVGSNAEHDSLANGHSIVGGAEVSHEDMVGRAPIYRGRSNHSAKETSSRPPVRASTSSGKKE